MATKGRKKKQTEMVVVAIKPSEFKQAIADASRLQQQAATAQGLASRGRNSYCKRTGFPSKIFGWLRSLDAMEDAYRRESLIREFIFGCEVLGFLAQRDMFDDVATKVEELRQNEERAPDNGASNVLPLDEAERRFESARRKNPPKNPVEDVAGGRLN